MSNQVQLPRVMEIGAGASQKIAEVLTGFGCKAPLLVTDNVMVSLGYPDKIIQSLSQAGMDCAVFSDTVPEPTVSSISQGVDVFRQGQYDAIIALGGGSPIDSAKAINILGTHGGAMRDYKFPRVVTEAGVPLIAIPTTAGTGSEVTRFTIITDDEADEKMLCLGLGFMPDAALVDYELTSSVPPRVTADTGIDALTHAIEAYVSQKANLFSDAQATAAMRLIAPNLRKAYHEPNNHEAREAMMLGSTLAGMAFSAASVALVHGMSRPIGAFFHVPHGLSNAMLLPAITQFSIPSAKSRYADCARHMGIVLQEASDDVACHSLVQELIAINQELSVPTMSEFGIDKEQYFSLCEVMAEQALASGSPGNNPRVPSQQEIVGLYHQLWA
ncbi:iron-containing alcohol dehydrogenase [Vibrio sp. S9_S30]|uniref:iron-containing alcohol dehydrogenase n=1 Tax=Vibrio sp. S9_S30 TaxID=2720226 RepID=UPI0016810215|nr:iron-containing alcohol dehydrogenase [Vibrio sp. S9_S30]MBD1558184.1 iron-containing alcohol dehydrogenase [Vibrio sp. S9_S30]